MIISHFRVYLTVPLLRHCDIRVLLSTAGSPADIDDAMTDLNLGDQRKKTLLPAPTPDFKESPEFKVARVSMPEVHA